MTMMKHLILLIIKYKDYFIGLCIGIPFLAIGILIGPADRGKYRIYAAGQAWSTNHFQVSGNTVYFTSTDDKNVCIVGDYTLIYERESEQQGTAETAAK